MEETYTEWTLEDLPRIILELIKRLQGSGKEVTKVGMMAVLIGNTGFVRRDVEVVMKTLLASGEVFEPKPKVYRVIQK